MEFARIVNAQRSAGNERRLNFPIPDALKRSLQFRIFGRNVDAMRERTSERAKTDREKWRNIRTSTVHKMPENFMCFRFRSFHCICFNCFVHIIRLLRFPCNRRLFAHGTRVKWYEYGRIMSATWRTNSRAPESQIKIAANKNQLTHNTEQHCAINTEIVVHCILWILGIDENCCKWCHIRLHWFVREVQFFPQSWANKLSDTYSNKMIDLPHASVQNSQSRGYLKEWVGTKKKRNRER